MFLIVFEFTTPASRRELSAGYYAKLQKLVHRQPGFIAETAFISPTQKEQGVLFARFKDEQSAQHWRRNPIHLHIQWSARNQIFADYRLRVGPMRSCTEIGKLPHIESSEPSEPSHGTGMLMVVEHRQDDVVSREQVTALISGLPRSECIEITTYVNETTTFYILSWREAAAAAQFSTSLGIQSDITVSCMAIARDYGKNDRKQAPEDADRLQAKYADEMPEDSQYNRPDEQLS